jgi:hypothetical protein
LTGICLLIAVAVSNSESNDSRQAKNQLERSTKRLWQNVTVPEVVGTGRIPRTFSVRIFRSPKCSSVYQILDNATVYILIR